MDLGGGGATWLTRATRPRRARVLAVEAIDEAMDDALLIIESFSGSSFFPFCCSAVSSSFSLVGYITVIVLGRLPRLVLMPLVVDATDEAIDDALLAIESFSVSLFASSSRATSSSFSVLSCCDDSSIVIVMVLGRRPRRLGNVLDAVDEATDEATLVIDSFKSSFSVLSCCCCCSSTMLVGS